MTVKIIFNPYANRKKALRVLPRIQAAFDRRGIAYVLAQTERPGHGTELAREAVAEGVELVIAAGGDGTVNEVLNGLVQAAGDHPTLPLAVLPIGTGNDFAAMQSVPQNVDELIAAIDSRQLRQVDIGRVDIPNQPPQFFDNNCALAMEPMVNIENIAIKWISGTLGYVVALIKALFKLSAWQMTVEWDDGKHEGPMYMVSVCNGPRAGSTFLLAPDAKVDDGLFDVILIPELPILTVLRVLPRLLNGSHLKHPLINCVRTKSLRVHSRPGTPVHADGEMVSYSAEEVTYTLLPKKLTLLTK